jgi:hypothetical protein
MMDSVARLILRFLLVPLGAMVATVVAVVVLVLAHWNLFVLQATKAPGLMEDYVFTLIVAAPAILFVLAISVSLMLVPAAIGILIAEAFAIRSWIYHAANGGLSAWIGGAMVNGFNDEYFTNPMLTVASGLAAGLAYWLVAGWTAGFFKPISGAAASPPRTT